MFDKTPGTLFLMMATALMIGMIGLVPDHNNSFFFDGEKIMEGQYWRIITPIFIHIGILHLFLNMMAMLQLGRSVENRIGTVNFLLMSLAIGAISNTAEACCHTQWFGGMSGVLFGLFGFRWGRNQLTNGREFSEMNNSSEVMEVMIFFFVCVIFLNGIVANYAHGAGLLSGFWFAILYKQSK